MEQKLTAEQLEQYNAAFMGDRANRAAMTAVTNAGVNEAAKNQEVFRKTTHEFSLTLKQGHVTAQKQSGRCWMFAAMNVLRYQLIHSLNLEDFDCLRIIHYFSINWKNPITFWRISWRHSMSLLTAVYSPGFCPRRSEMAANGI